MLEESKKQGTVNRGLHSGRQGHDVKIVSLIEELKYDISYSSYKLLINFDNDAASCYDRILLNISSLLARKKGMQKNVTFVHATTLEKAKYRLKTALGVSESSGQDATNFLHTWLVISSTICDIYKQSANGTEFISLHQDVSILLAILGFVDGMINQVNKFQNNEVTLQELLENMQQDSQLWAMLLWLTGGLLELQKCLYHVIHFEFKEDGMPQFMTEAPNIPL
eukprot:12643393-Ditylum_brightwellii.AAC.1